MALSTTLNITQRKYFLSELGLNNHKFISRLASVNIFDILVNNLVTLTLNKQLNKQEYQLALKPKLGAIRCSEWWKI